MFQTLYTQIGLGLLTFSCGFAIWKGSAAERAGGLLIVATWLLTLAATTLSRNYVTATAFLVSDGLLALGLLILAVRFSSWWLGAAMLIQAIELAFHAGYFAAEKADLSYHVLWNYIAGKNLASAVMLIVIVFATLSSIRKRAHARARERDGAAERLTTATPAHV